MDFYSLFLGMSVGLFWVLSEYWSDGFRFKHHLIVFISFLCAYVGAKTVYGVASGPILWWGPGFVFYGALLGGGGALFLFSTLLNAGDFSFLKGAPAAICFSHALGRIGCWWAGCCAGEIWKGGIPVQLAESFLLICLGMVLRYKKWGWRFYLLAYALLRFGLEFAREDNIRGIFWIFSTSQWISLVLIFVIGFVAILGFNDEETSSNIFSSSN